MGELQTLTLNQLARLAAVQLTDLVGVEPAGGGIGSASVQQLIDAVNHYVYAANTERVTALEVAVQSAAAAGIIAVAKDSLALLTADLAWDAGKIGWVHSDADGTKNDLYKKTGASGAGGWTALKLFKPKNAWFACTPGGSGTNVTLAPDADFGAVSDQKIFCWTSIGPNAGGLTVAVPGINGGAAAAVLLPSGDPVPDATTKNTYFCAVRFRPATGKYELLFPQVRQQPTHILCNATQVGSSLTLTIAQAAIPLPADGTNVIFEYEAPANKPIGGADVRVLSHDGVELLPQISLFDGDGVSAIPDLGWLKGEMQQIRRQYGGYGADNGSFKRLTPADTITPGLSNLIAGVETGLPPKNAPVLLRRLTTRNYEVVIGGIVADNVDDYSRADRHHCLVYDFGNAMSQGVLKSATAFATYAQWGIVDGRRIDFMALASDEKGGGYFDAISPSTIEHAYGVGLESDPLNAVFPDGKPKHDRYGVGHGLIELVPGSASMTGESFDYQSGTWTATGDLKNMAIGSSIRLRKLVVSSLYDVFRPPQDAPIKIGQMLLISTYDKDGLFITHTHKIGRALGFDLGTAQPAEGDVITGATSGATATVVVIPDTDSTGTWAGENRTGEIFVKNVVGIFQAGENLRVGGVTKARAIGPAGPPISMQNSYSAMGPTTNVNRAKPIGLAEITIGQEDNRQHPVAFGGTWPGVSRVAFRHTRAPDVLFETILYKKIAGVWTEAACPIDPPGDFSECETTKVWVQERDEGVRKLYIQPRSGTAVRRWEGTFTTAFRQRLRKGALL
jgi:hypothetical protein